MTNCPTKKLKEICEIKIGGTPRRGVVEYWENGELPWVSIADMSRGGKVIIETKEKITKKGIKESNVKFIPKGSLLFSFKLSIGKLAFAGHDLYTNEAIAGLVIKDENELDKNFLFYYLSQMSFDDTTSAVKGKTLNKTKVENLEIPLPPLEIQEKIVARLDEILGGIAKAKALRERALADTEKILSATLREIFEGGKEKGWEEKEISSVAKVSPVKSEIKEAPDDQKVSFVPMSAVSEISQSIETQEIRTLGDVRKGYTYFKKGDVILAKVTPCMENGKIAHTENLEHEIGFGSSEFHVIRADKEKVLSKFIYQILRTKEFRQEAETKMTGTSGLRRVPKEFVEKYKIPLPPLSEQQKIVERLDALSSRVAELRALQESQLTDLKNLEKSYLREAFNGELDM